MSGRILITGGTGLIGSRLSELLIDQGYEVAHLSRQANPHARYKTFRWDIQNQFIDDNVLGYADYIVNLAGTSVAEGKWTPQRKKEILESRVQGTQLLRTCLSKTKHHVKAFISASAVGIYGDTHDRLVTEESAYGDDFLANVTKQWEAAAWQIHELNIRTCILRIGVVLSDKGGALPQMARPVKLMAGAPLGSGKQYMSWIHIDDLCRLFIQAIENTSYQGVFNAVAPNPVTNKEFTQALADVMHRPLTGLKVPAFGLKMVLGEMSEVVLEGQRVSCDKLTKQGFTFEYNTIHEALESFYTTQKAE
ncbi:NAD-dependent epimerase [Adhaeribacter aerolatus]|uniref:NAD-dependent epimerase n=1 Tax=Adhaeribacter aerolatus TaxID=670289 RepID=A0A512B380_9BACT|nr:TIGR01777 family oxidoreductase [Adhaeribacter aerolatus]GEO06418.1 NAD-dependent epimerase [Adhaeribacter aerolatus]